MEILYEDDEIIVVNKEAGLAVQARSAGQKDLESMLLTYLASGGHVPELHVVHRIDQPVEGLVLFAKTKEAAADLTRQLTDGRMKKIYRAQVAGRIPKEEDTLEDYLVRDAGNVTRVVPPPSKKIRGKNAPKKAVLHYRKLSDKELIIELFSGRHHQIRVQLAHAGMPIIGDRKYGKPDPDYRGRLMLTAWQLVLFHPLTKEKMVFTTNDKEKEKNL